MGYCGIGSRQGLIGRVMVFSNVSRQGHISRVMIFGVVSLQGHIVRVMAFPREGTDRGGRVPEDPEQPALRGHPAHPGDSPG